VNGPWSPWRSHGIPPDTDQITLLLGGNQDGRLDLLAPMTTPGSAQEWHTWHSAQTQPNGIWNSWTKLPDQADDHTPIGTPALGRNADGRLELFGLTADGAMWHQWQKTPGGSWSKWFSSGRPDGVELGYSLVVASNADGRLEAFAGGTLSGGDADHQEIWHIWQTQPNGSWSAWRRLGRPGGGIGSMGACLAVSASDDGRLEAFAAAADGNLWHTWQTTPNGAWSAWLSHGRPPGSHSVWMPVLARS
jgi:hypothetical protein